VVAARVVRRGPVDGRVRPSVVGGRGGAGLAARAAPRRRADPCEAVEPTSHLESGRRNRPPPRRLRPGNRVSPSNEEDTRMQHRVIGTTMPVLEVTLAPGEKVFAQTGELSWLTPSIEMETSTSAGGQQGGFFAAIGRALSGGTLFMTEYTAAG